jgi:molybdopterin converting factor small subunit
MGADIKIVVRLLLTFKEKAPAGERAFELQLTSGTRVSQVLEGLAISPSAPKVILVNGRASGGESELNDGDQLTVFPPLEGG